jgi:L-threonylcarbamoyladenylate synthase
MNLESTFSLAEISNAAAALKAGHLVAFPTETVYGLGADALNEKAVARIYTVKGRPTNHPLIVHISSVSQLNYWANAIPDYAFDLAGKYWPGPMTLILPQKEIARDFLTGGQNCIGLRIPANPIALGLLRAFEKLGGMGIAAPSANRFQSVSATTAKAVNDEIGTFLNSSDLVLDGGRCSIGIESTIIDCTEMRPRILRPGAIVKEMIETATGCSVVRTEVIPKTRASGMHGAHYSPKAHVRLDRTAEIGEGFIALSTIPTPPGAIRLGSPHSTEQFAHEIYESLRMGDSRGISRISVVLPQDGDLSEAIADRMTKAAIRQAT